MSKPKSLLKQGKGRKKHREESPQTADEFQAAGVDFEEAGEKWRAGDGVKSMRFFVRAIEVYETGMQKFPRSLDLAYNKARVQYEIATHPVLVRQLQAPLLSVLETALDSHRYALSLDQDNADTLFNTAQVLTSIAEEIVNDVSRSSAEALKLLEEALELQQRCLVLQEYKYAESQEQEAAAMDGADSPEHDGGVLLEPNADISEMSDTNMEQQEQWASIVEPVTKDALIDTAIAQLSTLTTLCSLLSSSPESAPDTSLAWVEEYSSKLLDVKFPSYAEGTNDRLQEIGLTKALFLSALLEAGFRSHKLDAQTYKRERDAAFNLQEINLENSSSALLANASSLIAFNSALADTASVQGEMGSLSSVRWNALSAATCNLAKASKIVDTPEEDISKTHLVRGDASILQYQLSKPPASYQPAISNATVLLKNAEVFYRNASKLSKHNDEEKDEALLKESLAVFIQNSKESVKLAATAERRGPDWMRERVSDMVDEGLLTPNELESLGWIGQ